MLTVIGDKDGSAYDDPVVWSLDNYVETDYENKLTPNENVDEDWGWRRYFTRSSDNHSARLYMRYLDFEGSCQDYYNTKYGRRNLRG